MKTLTLTLAFAISGMLLTFATQASADCDPKCTDGQVCRYSNSGGTDIYTCKDPKAAKAKSRVGDGRRQGAAEQGPVGGGAPSAGQIQGVER